MEIHLYFLGIPLLLVIVLVALIWRQKGPHPATYKIVGVMDASPDSVGRHRRGFR